MSDMNICALTGRLTGDPRSIQTSGKAMTSFRLAVNGWKDNETLFIDCVAWGKTAEVILQNLSKGSRVGVNGRLGENAYQKNDGTQVRGVELSVSNLTFLDAKGERQSVSEPVGSGIDPGDVPF